MSTNHSAGRSASKPEKDRSPNLCTFAFADGRQCRTPRCSGHLHFCYFHAQKEAQSLAAQQVGEDISRFLPTKLLTACDLGVALSRTFCAVAQGQIKPKVASTLGYLAQTMLQSIPIAQHEYCESLGTDYWRSAIRSSFKVATPQPEPKPAPRPQPAQPPSKPPAPASVSSVSPVCHPERSEGPQPIPATQRSSVAHPACHEESASSLNSSLATHHSSLPLPPTSAEFAQQLLAARNSSPSETSPHSDVVAQAFRPEESASSSNSSLACPPWRATDHSPLPHPAPPPLPPGFGAPANWDVLIPPKPRRRFSR